ncbi:MAG: sulfotransferase [Burkholderiales bacterium]|nr:sulfotransferase [Burkholderiales bacterium]
MTTPAGFPDFFVIGAPRCGTTSLCRYLGKHPHICFSRPKEPHYFTRIGALPAPAEIERDYIGRHFGHREARHRVAGEGSVSYLYASEAIERVLRFNPAARFIVMLRNPLAMLPSYHLKMRFLLLEDRADFATAWRLQEARARGEKLPRHCFDRRLLLYGEAARFGMQLERLYGMAGRERTHVILFDDFVEDTLAEYRRVLDFLRLDYDQRTQFLRRNESRIYRYRWLQELLVLPAKHGGGAATVAQRVERKRKHGRFGGAKKASWIKRLAEWNRVPTAPAPLSPEMRATVAAYLRADVELLSRLLGRDLRGWLAQAGPVPKPGLARVAEIA